MSLRRSKCWLTALFSVFLVSSSQAEEKAWILAGQSNMGGGHSAYGRQLQELVESKGDTYRGIISTRPGRPIEDWIDSNSKGYEELWQEKMVEGIK